MSHTPGPWEAHDAGKDFPTVCAPTGENRCQPLADTCAPVEVNTANAFLMAAAPDLLKVAEHALVYFSGSVLGSRETVLAQEAREAIAKVRGSE